MRLRGTYRLGRAARRLRNRLARKGAVLMYHSVAEVETDPFGMSVTPRRFAEHLEVLRRQSRPLGLRLMAERLRAGGLPPRAVAVTFDDGYANNFHNAAPLLERYEIPATVFVATAHVGAGREFWWDELEGLLLRPGRLPATLRLSVGGRAHVWELAEAATYTQSEQRLHGGWRFSQPPPGPRHALYRELWHLLHPLEEAERGEVLGELRDWAGAAPRPRESHRAVGPEELRRFGAHPLIDVGAHTVTHTALSALPAARQREEIRESKSRLEVLTGRPVDCFAYPFGKPSHYTEESVAIVRESGFTCACSNFPGLVGRGTDLFQLPRFYVSDWDGEEFAGRLSDWFCG